MRLLHKTLLSVMLAVLVFAIYAAAQAKPKVRWWPRHFFGNDSRVPGMFAGCVLNRIVFSFRRAYRCRRKYKIWWT